MRTLSLALATLALSACRTPEPVEVDADTDGVLVSQGDCNDADANVHPSAPETCDGVDNDCDGVIDEQATDATTFYMDRDGDGFGGASDTRDACERPDGFVTDATDCDDTASAVYPAAPETDCTDPVDYNCDGSTGFADADADGFAACQDCDDAAAAVNPDAVESCDGVDNDCDGATDEPGAVGEQTWYADADADAYGYALDAAQACAQPAGYVANGTDCNDASADAYPGAAETCDGVDNDCDGRVDGPQAAGASAWYGDGDGDGYGAGPSVTDCAAPAGFVATRTDCDDARPSVYPGAPELCDTLDNSCDGLVDEGLTSTWYADLDGDGHGRPTFAQQACEQPLGFVASKDDCDDEHASAYPGAPERCDDLDNNCDGVVDEGVTSTWYADLDGDGHGRSGNSASACSQPGGYVSSKDDCDDLDQSVFPGAPELCDGLDNACAGNVPLDERDADHDSWMGCEGDCNDSNVRVNPNVLEVCNYVDDDCDGVVDNDLQTNYYADADLDGYGDLATLTSECLAPPGYITDSTDCDDADANSYPGAVEVWYDGVDQDCDGANDFDQDGDGHESAAYGGDDLNDTDATCWDLCGDGLAQLSAADSCATLLADFPGSPSGPYWLDPDADGDKSNAIQATCDMVTDGGGWTLCASLTKGYVPADMLYNQPRYAFQARLNGNSDFVYDEEAPARTTATWNNPTQLNYGTFCRQLGNNVSQTRLITKNWNWANNYGASAKNSAYNLTRQGVYTGNLFTQWFTNTGAARTFTYVSGDHLYVQANNNGYGGPYTTPSVGWAASNQAPPYTQSTNPWNDVNNSVSCTGCTNSGAGYTTLPYGGGTLLNNMADPFWAGIPNVRYGWTDCTANGNCNYHESGLGVWLFYVR